MSLDLTTLTAKLESVLVPQSDGTKKEHAVHHMDMAAWPTFKIILADKDKDVFHDDLVMKIVRRVCPTLSDEEASGLSPIQAMAILSISIGGIDAVLAELGKGQGSAQQTPKQKISPSLRRTKTR